MDYQVTACGRYQIDELIVIFYDALTNIVKLKKDKRNEAG